MLASDKRLGYYKSSMKPGDLVKCRYPRTSGLLHEAGASDEFKFNRGWRDITEKAVGLVISQRNPKFDEYAQTYKVLILIEDKLYWIDPREFEVIS